MCGQQMVVPARLAEGMLMLAEQSAAEAPVPEKLMAADDSSHPQPKPAAPSSRM